MHRYAAGVLAVLLAVIGAAAQSNITVRGDLHAGAEVTAAWERQEKLRS